MARQLGSRSKLAGMILPRGARLAAWPICLAMIGAGCGAGRPPEGAAGPGRIGDGPASPTGDAGPAVDVVPTVDGAPEAGTGADAGPGPAAGAKADRRRAIRRSVIAGDAISDRFLELICDPGWPVGSHALLEFARTIPEVREARYDARTEDASVVYHSGVFHIFHHHPEEDDPERCRGPVSHRIPTACGCGCLDLERFCYGEDDRAVRYRLRDPDRCAATDAACPERQTLFGDACGCGCLIGTPSCPAEDAAGVTYRSRDPTECEGMDLGCAEGEQPFGR